MKRTISTIILILTVSFSQAQKTPEPIIKQFFKEYVFNGPEVAITNLYNSNPWIDHNSEAVLNTKYQLLKANKELLGAYIGYEEIQSKIITKDYYISSYFVKFDRQMLRFTFSFYRPTDEWRLQGFRFDDTYDDEVDESMKLYYVDFK